VEDERDPSRRTGGRTGGQKRGSGWRGVREWWREKVCYQIYPRSFSDSNGDGIGDIPGIISRLDEIRALGAGVIWLSPVYPSPDADNGYDISNYYAIDPRFGTMDDMDSLFDQARRRGIRVIMDLVVNHTSDEHEWFQKSRDKASPYRDWSIWRPGKTGRKGEALPPNNWTGFFGGPVWEYDGASGEYYLHLFDRKQPDLNYHNPAVIAEVKNILRFWLDRGAAGFRCDVINIIYKASFADGKRSLTVRGNEHYKTTEGCHRVLRELRRDVLDAYDCFTVGETVMVDLSEAQALSAASRRELDMLFYFEHLEIDRRIARFIPRRFSAKKLLAVLTKWQQGLEWNAVYLENHDQSRIVSHFGAGGPAPGRPRSVEYWRRSAKMLALMELTLRGTVFIYQGQEIGMTNFDYTGLASVNDVESRSLDRLMRRLHIPAFLRWRWIRASSRDNARTPMQWSAAPNAGFTTGAPWLAVNGNHTLINYESQRNDPGSVLAFYQTMIALRSRSECLQSGLFIPVYAGRRLMAYAREGAGEAYTVLLNFSASEIRLPITAKGAVIASSTGRTTIKNTLLPWEGILIK
jgi:oligo-1,6-glucosidase